ncbi:YHS domain-containing (seleno)protein [Paracoccus sediminicola]|uniref:YHS domain-containing (seleno)protein n=1 Tax=Paracoccus sediminicola TaxID=3017783 RepID=UPI0022F1396E|nr:YHS domain-containing (seleno)protein [Paracoccus sediminicola]WBU55952.1 YHS domain-containing (seleno)protein [Paracoccus sediminicola]
MSLKLLKPLIFVLLASLPSASLAQKWALGGYDPVAYVTRDQAVPGRGDISTKWRGKDYHFASNENRALFESNPRAYTPGFDGLCVVALAEGRAEPGDPRQFVTIGQRVYLTGSSARKRELLERPRKILMEAKGMWVKLRP